MRLTAISTRLSLISGGVTTYQRSGGKTTFWRGQKNERSFLSDLLCQQPALSRLFDLNKNLTIHINDDYGKGAATLCKIRGNQIVLHLFEGDLLP
jgi:hypothetical protein